jgi:phospholipase C
MARLVPDLFPSRAVAFSASLGSSVRPLTHLLPNPPNITEDEMKFVAISLLLLAVLGATFAHAQTNNIPQVQHVIVVIQENRTPDNLFGSDAFASQRQLPGADLVQTGKCSISGQQTILLQPLSLATPCDPDHSHSIGWVNS